MITNKQLQIINSYNNNNNGTQNELLIKYCDNIRNIMKFNN